MVLCLSFTTTLNSDENGDIDCSDVILSDSDSTKRLVGNIFHLKKLSYIVEASWIKFLCFLIITLHAYLVGLIH